MPHLGDELQHLAHLHEPQRGPDGEPRDGVRHDRRDARAARERDEEHRRDDDDADVSEQRVVGHAEAKRHGWGILRPGRGGGGSPGCDARPEDTT